MQKILILYSTSEGHTKKVADFMAEFLKEKGYKIECHRVKKVKDNPQIKNYDGIIIGASIHAGMYSGVIKKIVKKNIESISSKPSAFFTVCLTAKSMDEKTKSKSEVEGYIESFLSETGLNPVNKKAFAGALLYKDYDPFRRAILKSINKKSGGDTDTSKNYEYTNWDSVNNFLLEFIDKSK